MAWADKSCGNKLTADKSTDGSMQHSETEHQAGRHLYGVWSALTPTRNVKRADTYTKYKATPTQNVKSVKTYTECEAR